MPSRFLQDTSLKTRHSTVQLMQYTELKVKKLSNFCDYFQLVLYCTVCEYSVFLDKVYSATCCLLLYFSHIHRYIL